MTPSTNQVGRAAAAIQDLMLSGRPLIFIHSSEEDRVRRLLQEACVLALGSSLPLWTWSLTAGLRPPQADVPARAAGPREVLDFIADHAEPGIFLLLDFHEPLRESASVRRRLRDLYTSCLDRTKFVIISSAVAFIPDELARQVAFLELLIPDLEELLSFVQTEMAQLAGRGIPVDPAESAAYAFARALQGLTIEEARHAVKRAVSIAGRLDPSVLMLLQEEKKLIVSKSGLVQYISEGTSIEHVGGLENMKKWLFERRRLFLERDSLAAEIVPKGVLVMGVSGCGKSLSVKAIASCFELPLYRVEMIEVFSGRHGNPDAAFVEACRSVESVAPAVIWFDEIEMGLTGQTGESSSFIGHIFAYFLTWMQEKARGLFVAATANRIDLLPAEMIRKGRFDELFFIDLPTEDERVDIFRIHAQKRGIDHEALQIARLRKISQGWTGAEIEQCVISAITAARLEGRAPLFEDLHRAAQSVVPLSKSMREQVERIRSWAYDRALRASPRESAY